MPGFEYRRATWDEVCELGPQGWRLVAVPPIAEMRNVLGQPQMGEPLYAMEREIVLAAGSGGGGGFRIIGGEPPTMSGSLP
ncbi:MAG TPA: hypothetical protein VL551_11845 [Actinospica sp.]|nr:hypothetical protein [Actinospica sp.]